MSKMYIFGKSKLRLFEGPIRFAIHKTKEEEMMEKVAKDLRERSQYYCLICGIYLEINERNEKNLCCVCILKNTKEDEGKVK